jgi:hypothetical protein
MVPNDPIVGLATVQSAETFGHFWLIGAPAASNPARSLLAVPSTISWP